MLVQRARKHEIFVDTYGRVRVGAEPARLPPAGRGELTCVLAPTTARRGARGDVDDTHRYFFYYR